MQEEELSKGDILLAIDAGNTTIECGLFSGEESVADWHLASSTPRLSDEYWQNVVFFTREAGIEPKWIKALALASVVPEHTWALTLMANRYFGIEPFVVTSEAYPYPVRLIDPHSVGADRLCSAAAGYKRTGGPLIVVDFGTAITLDVVAVDGSYLGGAILPGPAMAAHSLHRRTAQLPDIVPQFSSPVIGMNTEQALQSGVTWGIVDMVDGLIQRISRELALEPNVLCTGGYGAMYAKQSRKFKDFSPRLVLEGVRLLYQLQAKQS
ncbi:MAG: type III pantothenate kinase [Calditrichaeota bacterium]|nr:type III pantothenate kinase [Calditrichota bacterium]